MIRVAVLALGIAGLAVPAAAADKLSLMLDWFVNPDHAAIMIARERGLFAAQNLDVEVIAPADPNDPPKLVAAGKVDLAVSYQPQLHVQVAAGLRLRRVATLVDSPLNTLVVLRDGPVKSIADLKGKRIGYSVGGFEDALLGTMLATAGAKLQDVRLININFALSPSLMSGQVDAVIGAFRNFELNQLDIHKRPGVAFYPEEFGVPLYDELIVVAHSDKLADARLRRFIDALETATAWLRNHPGEGWDIFKKTGKELDDELNRRAWRDTLPRLAASPGALDGNRYRRFADYLAAQGLIPRALPVAEYAVEIGR
jgi:putative hydroxymethylpyrimidine transport system substrate-binding protein